MRFFAIRLREAAGEMLLGVTAMVEYRQDRRAGKDRRSAVDTRAAEEKQKLGERRSNADRRILLDRRKSHSVSVERRNRD